LVGNRLVRSFCPSAAAREPIAANLTPYLAAGAQPKKPHKQETPRPPPPPRFGGKNQSEKTAESHPPQRASRSRPSPPIRPKKKCKKIGGDASHHAARALARA
jgi:hypothetical protein